MKNDTPLEALISYSLTKKKFIYSGKSLEVVVGARETRFDVIGRA